VPEKRERVHRQLTGRRLREPGQHLTERVEKIDRPEMIGEECRDVGLLQDVAELVRGSAS
jgi:hypothetical protein